MRGRVIDLVQGTPEWLEWRRGGITATAAGEIMGLYPSAWDKSPANLEAKLTGRASDWFNREARKRMDRGHEGEGLVREAFEAAEGRAYPPACVEHHRLPQIRASLDGLNAEHDSIAEFKWPTKPALLDKVRAGAIPSYYYCQVQHQLLAAGCRTAFFVVGYRAPCIDSTGRCQRFGCPVGCHAGDVRFASLLVKPNRHFIERMLAAELAFWENIQTIREAA